MTAVINVFLKEGVLDPQGKAVHHAQDLSPQVMYHFHAIQALLYAPTFQKHTGYQTRSLSLEI